MTEKSPYKEFAEKMMHPDSKFIPEILKCMINEDQAKLLVSLPGTSAQMAVKLNRKAEEIEADLKDMFRKGLAFKKVKGSEVLWRPPMHLGQFHDASIVWPEAPQRFLDLWRDYMGREWEELAPAFTKFFPRPFMRVIPIEKKIENDKIKILAPENINEIIESAERLAVTKCTCRLTMHKCDAPVEVCLQVNRGADYTIERGSGREISKAEAREIIKQCQEAGLVHTVMNTSHVGNFICNCCGCCCQSFTLLITHGVSLCDPSRYLPEVNAGACTGCGACEDRCWIDAIKLNGGDIPAIDANKCIGCGQCSIACPEGAITMIEIRDPDFIPA